MSKADQEELASFFQVAGIHGLPYVPWSGAGASDPAEQTGYCTHGSILFPTWHRPYVVLYEVRISTIVYEYYFMVDPLLPIANSAEARCGNCRDIYC